MPLGKLSRKQIDSAYLVLTEALKELQGDKNPNKLLDASNRFYTLIPHDFGMQSPPLLDDEDFIKVGVKQPVAYQTASAVGKWPTMQRQTVNCK